MMTMTQYELIRTAHRLYGKKIREIARDYGHHRQTVRKALRGQEPQSRPRREVQAPVMGPFAAFIEAWLQEDQQRPKKQRHTARRIFTRLVEEQHFAGSLRSVQQWVRRKKRELGLEGPEAMVPLCPTVGREAEIDWGEADVIFQGVQRTVKLFCMRPRYSGKTFARAYAAEVQEMFLDAHQQGFAFFGGIYPVLVYDNLKTAVRKVLKGRSRIEQQSFQSFRAYYNFEARFCNPAQGHEKGGVEGIVGYVRRNFLVPLPQVESFEELNAYLLAQCLKHDQNVLAHRGGHTTAALFAAEQPFLLPLPAHPYDGRKLVPVGVNAYQTCQVGGNWYSVPTAYVGCQVTAHVQCETITIYFGQKQIAEHGRLFEKGQWQLNPLHYLDLLYRKPGAFAEARPILQWREHWPESFDKAWEKLKQTHGEKAGTQEFIRILQLHHTYAPQEVQAAVQLALECQALGYESVKLLLHPEWSRQDTCVPLTAEQWQNLPDWCPEPPNLGQYDLLRN